MNPKEIKLLEESIKYTFTDQGLLKTSLTHRSCLNEPGTKESYERLEFLGDAVLEMLISSYLYKTYPDKQEGFLTAARSATVRTESLSGLAKRLYLGRFILMSKGEEVSGGRNNPSTLEDIIESLIGAIYSDGGISKAEAFFDTFIVPIAENMVSEDRLKDAKSSLQEKVQADGSGTPNYQTLKEIGPDHDKTFESVVIVNGKSIATGIGKSKQEAEQNAAQKALKLI